MKFYTIADFDFKDKNVLVRIDINSPIINKKLQDNDKIKANAQTLRGLSNKGAKVVAISHQGHKGQKDFISLKNHLRFLREHTKKSIKFVSDIHGKKAIKAILKLRKGEILLLENIRYDEEELKKLKDYTKTEMVKKLAPLFDCFINDAFSESHRSCTSILGFSKVLTAIAGLTMEKELKNLAKLKKPKKPYIFLLGGAKPEDLLVLMKNKRADKILLGGKIAELGLIAKGIKLGKKESLLKKEGHLKIIKDIKNNKK